MCCFVGIVGEVRSTSIFAAMRCSTERPDWYIQLLVYEALVITPESNAMVLPLPVSPEAGPDDIQLLDFSANASFFKQLSDMMPSGIQGFSAPAFLGPPRPKLEVHRVGSYDVSIVPTIDDFDRLSGAFRIETAAARIDDTPFRSRRSLFDIFRERYADHAFVVCQIAPGKVDIHPFAATFVTRYPGHLYFPTLHIHDGELRENAIFDHSLYAQQSKLGEDNLSALGRMARGADLVAKVPFLYEHLTMRRRKLAWELPNQDIYVPIDGPVEALPTSSRTAEEIMTSVELAERETRCCPDCGSLIPRMILFCPICWDRRHQR